MSFTAIITQMQFSRKTRKSYSQKQIFAEIDALYSSNIYSNLYCPKLIVSTFPEGLHLCSSPVLYSYHYTNAIFQKNKEELKPNFLSKKFNKGLTLF